MRATQEGTLPPLKVSGIEQARQRTQHSMPEETSSRVNIAIPATDGTHVTQSDNVGVLEEKINSIHSLLEERISSAGKEEKKDAEVVMKSGRADASEQEEGSGEMLAFVKLLYNTLLSNEVDEIYANQLTDEVEKVNKPGLPLEYILANVYQKMVLKFGSSETIQPADNGPKAVFFIGPTGVGKTTTIAKLASSLILTQKKKVALLPVDTYRIAATEQLKTYASILDIPFKVIYSADEIAQVYQ
ncbi:MAG: flagellar biosynthesis protein FlhF, partial [Lachnospiraceae bacterium]|nr:flagellar biosynthesis protein FlhF [Lachnospiraceae bacterium]